MCDTDPCDIQTIWWGQGTSVCLLSGKLAFKNVVISGRRRFKADCDADWCTHCLTPDYFVLREAGPETVIDRIPRVSLSSDYLQDTQCAGHDSEPIFVLGTGSELVLEGSVIADLRSRQQSFAILRGGSISFVRTEVRSVDFTKAFLAVEAEQASSISFIDSYFTGLNRDHPYTLDDFDGLLLLSDGTAFELIITRSVFEDNFALENGDLNDAKVLFISAFLQRLEISDSIFRHCTGGFSFRAIKSSGDFLIANTTFEENHSIKIPLLEVTFATSAQFVFEGVKWMRNTCSTTVFKFTVPAGFLELRNSAFHYNQLVKGNTQVFLFSGLANCTLINLELTENGQMKVRQKWFWADRLAPIGVFDQYLISFLENIHCNNMFKINGITSPQILNVTVSGTQETACEVLIYGGCLNVNSMKSSGSFQHLRMTMPAIFAVQLTWYSCQIAGTFSFSDSVIERSQNFISYTSNYDKGYSMKLVVENSVFRDSVRDMWNSRPFNFKGFAITISNCTFLNCFSINSALTIVTPYFSTKNSTVEVRDCVFRNNTSSTIAADLDISGTAWVDMSIRHSTFNDSKGLGFGGSMSFRSVRIIKAVVGNCSFSGITKSIRGAVYLVHSNGIVELSAVRFHSIMSPESMIVFLDASTSQASIVDSVITNCTFLIGIKLSPGALVRSSNNSVTESKGTLVWATQATFTDTGSALTGNTVVQGCLRLELGAQAELNGTLFAQNIVSGNSGAIYVRGENTTVVLRSCVFLDNTSSSSNGIILVFGSCMLYITRCFFENNSALDASVLTMQQNNITATIESTRLIRNSVMIQLIDSSLHMKDVVIAEEHFTSETGGIVLVRSQMILEQSTIQDISGVRGCLAIGISDSTLSLRGVVMRRVTCDKEVVAMSLNSTLAITDTSIRESASLELTFTSVSNGILQLRNVTISAVSAIRAMIQISETIATFSYCNVSGSEMTILFIERGGEISIDHSNFENINVKGGALAGVIHCSECNSLEIVSSFFNNVSANSVGGVSATAPRVVVHDSEFRDLKSKDYGALFISANEITVSYSVFYSNSASMNSSTGGAITLSSKKSEISHCLLQGNSASAGGAVRWMVSEPRFIENVFRDNHAVYGPDVASFASTLHVVSDYVSVLASGQAYNGQLVVQILDHIGQVIRNDNSSKAVMSGKALSGSIQGTALMGSFVFKQFMLIETPGTFTNVSVALTGTALNVTLQLHLRECIGGEVLNANKCVLCPLNTYSFDVYSGNCSYCLANANCHDGQIYPKPGYWRHNNLSEEVIECPFRAACLGAVNLSTTGVCSALYTGNLCQSCAEGATRSVRDRCKQCLPDPIEQVRLAFLALALFLFLLALAMFAQHQNSQVGTMLKMLLNYAHLTLLIAQFELNWPNELGSFFEIHYFLGNAAEQLLSFDCTSEQLLKKVVAAAVLPSFLFIMGAVLWTFIRLFKKWECEVLLRFWTVSLFYCYPFVLRTSLSLFECKSIIAEEWVRLELEIRCWDRRHSYYALAVALPTLLLWGIGLPALALLRLFRQREQTARSSLCFFSNGYRRRYLHWEFLILARKACLIAIYVFLSDLQLALQGLCLCGVLWVAAGIQSRFSVFEFRAFNQMELRGIYVGLFTTFCGLCLGENLSTLAEYILLTLVVLAHCYFLVIWAIALALMLSPRLQRSAKFVKRWTQVESHIGAGIRPVFSSLMKSLFLKKLALQQVRYLD